MDEKCCTRPSNFTGGDLDEKACREAIELLQERNRWKINRSFMFAQKIIQPSKLPSLNINISI